MQKIRITAGPVQMTATLNDTETAKKLWEILPTENSGSRWGDEIYFPIPTKMQEQDAQASVPSGTIAFWPPGDSFCIFFGQTPASPVNVIGTLDGNPDEFKQISGGQLIRLEKAGES